MGFQKKGRKYDLTELLAVRKRNLVTGTCTGHIPAQGCHDDVTTKIDRILPFESDLRNSAEGRLDAETFLEPTKFFKNMYKVPNQAHQIMGKRPHPKSSKGKEQKAGVASTTKVTPQKRKNVESSNTEKVVAIESPKDYTDVPDETPPVETWSKSKKKRMRMLRAKQHQKSESDAPTTSVVTEKETSMATTIDEGTQSKTSKLQNEFKARLSGSRFRILNEELYTTTSEESYERFSKNPELFEQYHEGFRHQVESWPVNPVDVIVRWLSSRYQQSSCVVADFGCGDAQLAKDLLKIKKHNETSPFTVHSFDLVSPNELVTACDMANVPLKNKSVDVCVFCLSLMGTNLADFIREAHRVLKDNGVVKIAEVRSRIEYSHSNSSSTKAKVHEKDTTKKAGTLSEFLDILKQLGFKCTKKDLSNKMFLLLDLEKTGKSPDKKLEFSAKPCIYKRR